MSTDIKNLDLSALDSLTPQEKELALKILGEYAEKGESQLHTDLKYSEYEEIPVDIETFLYDRTYLGNGLIDGNGKMTVFPYWIETLKKIFPNNLDTSYNTLVLTGGIGLGKSFMAVLCMLYMLYRMLCLKDPYTHFGLQPIDKITFSMINITLDAAKGVGWDKLQQLLQSSPWFMSHGEMKGTSNLTWQPPKGIELIVGSQNRHVIGRAVFCNFTDECVSADTQILTEHGCVRIADLENTETRFITLNPETKQLEYSYPCKVQETVKSNDYYEIELEDGTILKCTGTHRLMLKDGSYKYVKDLTETDELADLNQCLSSDMTYDQFINKIISTRGQWGISDTEYFEAHHIIPCCLGGLPKRSEGLQKYKKEHHENIIWLYPNEHFIAHKLLALEHPDVYGLQSAYTFTSINKTIDQDDYTKLMNARRSLPEDLTNMISKYKKKKYKTRKYNQRKTNRDSSKNKLEIARRLALGIHGNKGSKNSMYQKGYKVSSGRNGHANMFYFYKGMKFESRVELIDYLKIINPAVTTNVICRLVKGLSTLRAYTKFKDIFDNLSWRYKDEN